MNSISAVVIVVNAVIQAGLLIYALTCGKRLQTGRYWLPITLLMLLAACGLYLLTPSESLTVIMPNGLLSVLLLTLMLTTFSSLVAADLSRQRF
jgi:hypothetical protein